MSTDHPDTVQVDDDERPPPVQVEPELPERAWYEKPPFWVAVVVVVLLSIPLLLEMTSGRRKAAAPKPAAASAAPVVVAEPAPPVEPPPAPEAAPPRRATPPSVVNRQPEPARQMITKCREKNGRIVYTQTGECSGSMVPVPIDTEKNLVDSPAPQLRPPSEPSR